MGPPPTISSPVPYVITGNTTIATDPTITSNGVTDYGTVYRGSIDDGPLSSWMFASTSAFDTQSGLDEFFSGADHLPLAALKFLALRLTRLTSARLTRRFRRSTSAQRTRAEPCPDSTDLRGR